MFGRMTEPSRLRMIASASLTCLVGVGLARFAYGPLVPAMIRAHWFGPSTVVVLGAANLAGYLAGAMLGPRLARAEQPVAIIRLMLALTTLSLFACAFPLSVPWFFAWRAVSGIAGGVLMVVAPPLVLGRIPEHHRGVAGGVIFGSLGVGVLFSAVVVPALLHESVRAAWLGLAAIATLASLLGWAGWPKASQASSGSVARPAPAGRRADTRALHAIYLAYGLAAFGYVPGMMFLADETAREFGRGIEAGAVVWAMFGVGAMLAPAVIGRVADRAGFRVTLAAAFLLLAAASVVPAELRALPAIAAAAILLGGLGAATVSLTLGRLHELLPPDADLRRTAWSRATVAFAAAQAIAGYAYAWLFAHTGGDDQLAFAFGAAFFAAGLGVLCAGDALRAPRALAVSDGACIE